MDGVPHITQDPIQPGDSFTYEFVARTPGSHMYHSPPQRDRPGRARAPRRVHRRAEGSARSATTGSTGSTQDIVWISNDSLGGFTINGRGFPATTPIVAKLGDKIAIRFMNEGSDDAPLASPRDADAGRRP